MDYSEKLKDERWQKKRKKILKRDGYACVYCGEKNKILHVHHMYYVEGKEVFDYDDDALITLCEDCHNKFHTDLKALNYLYSTTSLDKQNIIRGIAYVIYNSSCSCSEIAFDYIKNLCGTD